MNATKTITLVVVLLVELFFMNNFYKACKQVRIHVEKSAPRTQYRCYHKLERLKLKAFVAGIEFTVANTLTTAVVILITTCYL